MYLPFSYKIPVDDDDYDDGDDDDDTHTHTFLLSDRLDGIHSHQ